MDEFTKKLLAGEVKLNERIEDGKVTKTHVKKQKSAQQGQEELSSRPEEVDESSAYVHPSHSSASIVNNEVHDHMRSKRIGDTYKSSVGDTWHKVGPNSYVRHQNGITHHLSHEGNSFHNILIPHSELDVIQKTRGR